MPTLSTDIARYNPFIPDVNNIYILTSGMNGLYLAIFFVQTVSWLLSLYQAKYDDNGYNRSVGSIVA